MSHPASPSALATILMRNWMRRGLLACALFPLSLLFRALTTLRSLAYRRGLLASTRLPVPVVVVGNIFIGGTGKTPLTIWLVQALRRAGLHPGVVSRGYGGAPGVLQAVGPDSDVRLCGDEPLLIARHGACPVMVGRARAGAAQALLAAHPHVDVIVCDDGLQHYALQRDVEIMLFDQRGVGNGWLLPAGPLREPPARRRDFTVVNSGHAGAALPSGLGGPAHGMQLCGQLAARLCDGSVRPLAELAGASVLAAAGIGNPERFFAMLRAAGLQLETLALPDHYDFSVNPFEASTAEFILITEKDAVKCRQIEQLKNDPRLWVVAVAAQIDEALAQQIVEKIRGSKIT